MKRCKKKMAAILLTVSMALMAVACGQNETTGENLVKNEEKKKQTVVLFAPMEKIGRAHV